MRIPHNWTRLTGASMPQHLFSLEVDSRETRDPSRADWRGGELSAWHACGYRTDHHGAVTCWSGGGATVASLWSALEWSLRRGGMTWLVSTEACRVMSLAHVWEKIEAKEVRLDGRDERAGPESLGAGDVRGVRPGTARAGPGREGGGVGGVCALPRARQPGHSGRHPGKADGGAGGGVAIVEDPPTIVRLRRPGLPGRLQWVDLRNYGIDCWPDPSTAQCRAEWVLGVMEGMVAHLRSRKWGSLKTTAGSQAKAVLRTAYLTHLMEVHCDEAALSLERECYVGGRCECGRIGDVPGPVYHLDVRSMYPHVCTLQALPAALRCCGTSVPAVLEAGSKTEQGWVAEVRVESEEPAYPDTSARPTVYPVGRYWTVLAGPELDDAVAHGRVVEWGRWASYYLSPCLREYAREVYASRRDALVSGNKPLEQWIKRLSVSIVGKLGQSGWRWEPAPEEIPRGPWCQWARWTLDEGPTRIRSLGWTVQRQHNSGWADDSIPAIAAWVCSAARVRLLSEIRCAGWPNVLYCDTDSLHVTKEGYERLAECGRVGEGALGHLRLVEVAPSATYHGQKHYQIGSRRVCAGEPLGDGEPGRPAESFWWRLGPRDAINREVRPEMEEVLRPYRCAPTYRAGVVGPGGIIYPHRRGDG